MRVLFKHAALFFIAGFCATLNAQPPQMNFTVSGKVNEQGTDIPLEYVNVVIYSVRDSSLVSGSITHPDGTFSIQVNRPGRFYLTADFIGYEKTKVENITLNPGNPVFDAGTIVLKQATVGIEQVEIVSDRPYVSYHIDKKVVEVALNPSAQGGTAVDALQNVPSVQTDIEGNVSIRGNSNFTVLIDGRQSALSGSDALRAIPASSIEKIEIITNPSVKYDPDGTAGIINIISKTGKLNGHSAIVNLSAGNSPMYSGDITYSYKFDKLTFGAGLNYRNFGHDMFSITDQKTDRTDSLGRESTTIFKDDEGKMKMENFTVKGSVDYQLTKSNTVSVGGEFTDFSFKRNNSTKISQNNAFFDSVNNKQDFDIYQISSSGNASAPNSWQVKLGNRQVFNNNPENYFSVDLTVQNSEGDNSNFANRYLSDLNWQPIVQPELNKTAITNSTEKRYRVEANYANRFSDKFAIEAGYTLRIDMSKQTYNQFDMLYNNGEEPLGDMADIADFSRNINAGWAIVKGEIKTIKYSAGIRAETTNQSTTSQKDNFDYKYDSLVVFPSFSLSKEFNGGNQLQASYSKRINRPWDRMLSPFPNLSDGYFVFQPKPNLTPDYSNSFELNYQKSWGQSFVSIESFYRKTDHKMERLLIPLNDTLTMFTFKNMDYDKSVGGEVMANIKIAPWFILNTSASYYFYEEKGEFNDKVETVDNYNWETNLTCNFILPTKTRIQLIGQYEGPEVEIGAEESEVYWLSASARQEFFDRKLSATFRVEDIFSTRMNKQTTITGNTYLYSERWRKSPTVFISLSYRFNQQNGDRKRSGRPDDQNGNEGGGMDMDF